MPIQSSKSINLLPQDDSQSTTLGRILKWALTSFRTTVIITELIVMSAFLSRFWLDAKNSDLGENLNILKSQVSAYSETENEFRSYQKKLAIAKSLYSNDIDSSLVKEIISTLPNEVIINSIQRSEEGLLIKAYSYSERSVAQFLINIESLEMLSDVVLSQIASSIEDSAITTFAISAKVNQVGSGGVK